MKRRAVNVRVARTGKRAVNARKMTRGNAVKRRKR